MIFSKVNQRRLRSAIKSSKVRSGWLNEDQFVNLILFGVQNVDSPGHNFCIATLRGMMGMIEPENTFQDNRKTFNSLEDYFDVESNG